MNVSRKQV